ncbi:hypothetical protein HYN48_06960 [Flavobacterium magnum]|uniref:Uncharacterized protein n=1 Tax=Flavobacterium magnum TaxID=2162713 RepID=A0A2S0RD25_9FLAO|nr:hypothetical protein [Flavobacterium magnum]AWA29837.1 hypothetical protein HYN48_06960 [Flavobacterium magnum]
MENTINNGNTAAEDGYTPDSTTGSGFSEAERNVHEHTLSRNPVDPQHEDNGRIELVNKYNINDKAHSDSSAADFVKTVSKFHHADPDIQSDSDIQI